MISQVILDPKTSRRIFELAKDQQDELEMPEDEEVPEEDEDEEVLSKPRMQARFNEDEDGDHSENGEDIEEEYVSLSGFATALISIFLG